MWDTGGGGRSAAAAFLAIDVRTNEQTNKWTLASRKAPTLVAGAQLVSMGYRVVKPHGPTVICFESKPASDGQTDGQTDTPLVANINCKGIALMG